MPQHTLYLLPQPKHVEPLDGTFRLDADTQILLLPACAEGVVRSARALQRELETTTGLRPPIVRTARPARTENVILLLDDPGQAQAYMPRADLSAFDGLAAKGDQAYAVHLSPQRILAGGTGEMVAHLAVQTLRQMARAHGTRWPALRLRDWPAIPYRGVMLDVSRGKVPTLDTLKEIVDLLSLFKMNVLQLYTEHTFHFAHHPRIGQGCGSLTVDDILALDAYARSRYVELQPNLQSFGHCAHILSMPEYEHLAESAARWSLCPTDEGTYELLDDLYADLLPAFASTTLNVGCDETYDLGKGRSAARATEIGLGRLYLEHILRLRELAAKYGRRIQLWGDILLHYPDLVLELPEDVTLLDWHYEAEDDYPSVRLFAESGRRFWVCPGTSSWNTLFPRIENANANICTLARMAAEHGGEGLLNTDWGDYGHYQPTGQSYYGYAYGGEQAWTGGQTPDDAFDAAFARQHFGPEGEQVVATIRSLGRLNTLEGMPLRNASRSVYALLDEPLVGSVMDAVPEATLREMVSTCREAQSALRSAVSSVRDPLTVEEMAFSARLMEYAARKVLASQSLRGALDSLAGGDGDGRDVLEGGVETLRALDAELVGLREQFRDLWHRRARHSEIDISLGHIEGVRARFRMAEEWLRERLRQLDSGEPPDYDLADYAQGAEGYLVLGQAARKRWEELGLR